MDTLISGDLEFAYTGTAAEQPESSDELTTGMAMRRGDEEVATIKAKFAALQPELNEALRRRWVATEARALGRGGLSLVSSATGISLPTIRKGIHELEAGIALPPHRVRRPGGGRKPLLTKDQTLLGELNALLQANSAAPPLRWVAMTPSPLKQELARRGHTLSAPSLVKLLSERGYRWQFGPQAGPATQTLARWHYLTARVQQFLRCGQPVLALDLSHRRDLLPSQVARPPGAVSDAAGASPLANLLTVSSDSTSPALVGAALRCFLHPLDPRLWLSSGDLLVVVGQTRRLHPPRPWQTECDRLANELRRRVQIVLLPPGIYRWEAMAQCMTCHVMQASSGKPDLSARIEMGLVAQTPERWTDFAPRLYAASYPKGLITDARTDLDGDAWSFLSRVHGEPRRRGRTPPD